MPQTDKSIGADAGHIRELDGVRALSILAVLSAHLLPLGPGRWEINHAAGVLGMSMFFALSGFLITKFLFDAPNRIGPFFLRRSARIMPSLILYGFIVAVIIHGRWGSFFAILFFYINYSDSLILVGISHLWSICVEFHFYILIGVTVWLFGRRGFWIVPAAMLAVLVMKIEAGATASIRTHLRIDEIFAGSLVALVWLNNDNKYMSSFREIVAKGFWLWFALLVLSSHSISGYLMYLRPFFGFLALSGLLEQPEGAVRRALRWKVFFYIASISYALYIWHPIFRLGWFGEQGSVWSRYLVRRPITFIFTFIIAHISTNTLERFFSKKARDVERYFSDRGAGNGRDTKDSHPLSQRNPAE